MTRISSPERRGKARVRKSGTAVATRAPEFTRGVSTPVTPPLDARRRNRADRVTEYLSLGQVQLLRGAAAFAWSIGLPLNRHITFHLGKAGVPDEQAARLIGDMLKSAGGWVRYHGGTFAAAWSREQGQGYGSHVHIAAHVPDALATGFWRAMARWRGRADLRAPPGSRIQLTRCIGRYATAAAITPDLYAANLDSVMSYLAKGGVPTPAVAALVNRALAPGGRITGKRCGTTQNIGRAAWRRSIANG